MLPQVLEHAGGLARGLADDEAVGHVLDAGRGGGAERLAPGPRLRHAHRDLQRRRAVVDLVEEAAEVAREVVERAAGGDDVDEAEQGRAEVGVLRGEVHRLVVDRLQRVAARPRQRRGEIAPDRDDVGFRSRGLPRARRYRALRRVVLTQNCCVWGVRCRGLPGRLGGWPRIDVNNLGQCRATPLVARSPSACGRSGGSCRALSSRELGVARGDSGLLGAGAAVAAWFIAASMPSAAPCCGLRGIGWPRCWPAVPARSSAIAARRPTGNSSRPARSAST